MKRLGLLVTALGLLAGCTPTMAVYDHTSMGLIRSQIHPSVPGAYQVTWHITPGLFSIYSINMNTQEGREALLPHLIGEQCRNPQMFEESRAPFGAKVHGLSRYLLVTRVECG